MKLVSGIVDSGFFAQSALSAEIATKDSLGRNISETYLTAVDIPESATWNATTQTVSANSAQWAGGTANPQIPVTSTSGISIFESGDKVYFNISADYAFADDITGKQDSLTFGYHDTAISSIDNSALYDNSAHARINTLAGRISDLSSNKLDTTAFSDVSGTFLTAHQDLSDYQTTAGMTAYMSTADSAEFYTTANESGFITGVDLTPYQLTADMTAYQPVGDYMTTADSANFYTTANESGYITGVPDTYLQNIDLTITDGKITEISGVPLSAGDEFPQSATDAIGYVTATSANIDSTIDNVSANSGVWGGSALPISAGPGIKFVIVNDILVASTSGYVWQSASLFHTDTPVTQTTYTLSDNCSNYDRLDVDFYDINNWRTVMECPIPANLDASGTRGGYFSVVPASTATGASVWFKAFNWTAANTTWSCYCSEIAAAGGSTTQTVNANQPDNPPKVVNIIGWKRVGGN